MTRSVIQKNNDQINEPSGDGLKIRVEKAILLVAFVIILAALFLFPKYKTYAINKEILEEKTRISTGYPQEMTEEEYLGELGIIREKLETRRMNIPDHIDTAGLYAGIMEMAEETEVGLISVKFNPINTQLEDEIGIEIDDKFLENENKTIEGPDKRYLARCIFMVICSGGEVNCIRFLEEAEKQQPLIKVVDFEIKGDVSEKKMMTLKLESYGTTDKETTEKETIENRIE